MALQVTADKVGLLLYTEEWLDFFIEARFFISILVQRCLGL